MAEVRVSSRKEIGFKSTFVKEKIEGHYLNRWMEYTVRWNIVKKAGRFLV